MVGLRRLLNLAHAQCRRRQRPDRPACNLFAEPGLDTGPDGADGCARRLDDLNDDDRFAWEERVGICMIDGGLAQADAEDVAWAEIEGRRHAAATKGADGE